MATKHVEALFGPYAGHIIALEEGDAKLAISDGWARDPYDLSVEPKQLDRNKALKAAEKAARKLRGEEDEPKARPETEKTKAATPKSDEGGSYRTRQSEAKE
ncbi:hypothetical protein [Sinorhizobium fredii]|uniref:hypothetical protein n=1 Tax=Rhizobium fredii TaxID=380 RepID=UPI0004ADD63F|nr:hypothetical protein [Sinorhizobium fredii]